MRSLGRALVGLGLAGLAIGLLALSLIVTSDHATYRGLFAAFTLVVGWSFIGTGLFAWWRRPENRTGALMTATGFAWFLQAMTASNSPGIFTAGFALNTLAYGLLIHMLVAFPDGRLTTRAQRAVMALTWFVVTVAQWAVIPFIDPHDFSDCKNCPDNPLLSAATRASWICCSGCRRSSRSRRSPAWSSCSSGATGPRLPPSAARSGRCCGRAGSG